MNYTGLKLAGLFFLFVWLCLATGFAIVLYIKGKKEYRQIDEMLDSVLKGEELKQSDLNEGEISMFAGRLLHIQEKLDVEVGRAEEEKEQVKQLISNMSHQLKTPLANVMMYEELLEEESLSKKEQELFLQKLKIQSEKINWILQSLFKMINLEQNVIELRPEAIGIRETIQQAVSGVYEKAEKKGIRICVKEMSDTLLWHDRKWTREVFENLLENAVKYTDEGGSICISVECFEMYSGIHIQDNGRGISEDELVKVFGRFYRSPEVEQIEGSGIGLYLSKMILEKEKGYVTVNSDYGLGSCFSVFLQNCKK